MKLYVNLVKNLTSKVKDDFLEKFEKADFVENDSSVIFEIQDWIKNYIQPILEKILGRSVTIIVEGNKLSVTLDKSLTGDDLEDPEDSKLSDSLLEKALFSLILKGKLKDSFNNVPTKFWYDHILKPSLYGLDPVEPALYLPDGNILLNLGDSYSLDSVKSYLKEFNKNSSYKVGLRVYDADEDIDLSLDEDLLDEEVDENKGDDETEETEIVEETLEEPVEEPENNSDEDWITNVLTPSLRDFISSSDFNMDVEVRVSPKSKEIITIYIDPKDEYSENDKGDLVVKVGDSILSLESQVNFLGKLADKARSISKLPVRVILDSSSYKRVIVRL